jgi:hypothetical protein
LVARAPKTEFLRLFASESTANTPRTHCNTLLTPHRPVVLPVSSLSAFEKPPGTRGSRIGPGTPPKRGSAAGTALWRVLGGTQWGGRHIAGWFGGWCWSVGVEGGLASQWAQWWGLSGVSRGTAGEFFRLGGALGGELAGGALAGGAHAGGALGGAHLVG